MLARKGIFTTPSIDIRSRKTASELKTRRNFAIENSVYANYNISDKKRQSFFHLQTKNLKEYSLRFFE